MPKKRNIPQDSNASIRSTRSTDAVRGRYVNGRNRIGVPGTVDEAFDAMPSFGIMGIGRNIYRFFRGLIGGRNNNNNNRNVIRNTIKEEPRDVLNTAFIKYDDDDKSDIFGGPEEDDIIKEDDNDIDTGGNDNIIEEAENGSGGAELDDGMEEDSEEEEEEEGLEDVIVTKPEETSFLVQQNFENDYLREPKDKKPVFETHSYWKGGLSMHSYIGLRYTRRDPSSGRVYRKLMQIGFGGTGSVTGQGAIMDESYSGRPGADASTETPIDVPRFENVVGAVERTKNNIENFPRLGFLKRIFGSAKAAGTEFSGKYNVLTNNCNDFVIAMSRAAGVAAPARLHDTFFGPMTVYKDLANAAENGVLEGGTRIFQGGMERDESYDNLLNNFRQEITAAAASDGITISANPRLVQLLAILENDARNIREYRNGGGNRRQDQNDEPLNLDQMADEVSVHVRQAVELHLAKKHPYINIALMKLEALANDLRANDPGGQGIRNRVLDQEAEFILSQRTDAEKAYIDAGRTGNMTDAELYSSTGVNGEKKYSFDTGYAKGVGELILISLGEADTIHKQDVVESRDPRARDTQKRRLRAMRHVEASLRQEAKATKAREYIRRYIEDRPYLSANQAAKMITGCILQGMGLMELSRAMADIWSLDIDSGDHRDREREIRENFAGNDLTKSYQLAAVDDVLDTVSGIVSELMGEKPEGRRDEGKAAV